MIETMSTRVALDQRLEERQGLRMADLAAQMEEMLGPQHVLAPRLAQRVDHGLEMGEAVARPRALADRDRVEDGGDAGGGDLRVMAEDRGKAGQRTPGRGEKWFSRLSVCSSTRPGSR